MSMANNLKGVFASKGSKRLIFGLGFIVLVVVGYIYFGQPEPKSNPSTLPQVGRGEPTIQGGNAVDPEYRRNLQVADRNRADEARETGGSSVPTIVNQGADSELPVLLVDEKPDPLPQVSVPAAPVVTQTPVVIRPTVPVAPAVTAPPPVRDEKAVADLSAYMTGFRKRPPVAEVIRMHDGIIETAEETPTFSSPTTPTVAASAVELPLAGTVIYGELIGRVNSDSPGPVLATVLQGPYRGARLIGEFTTGEDSVVISFSKMSIDKDVNGNVINETVPIQAVAVDTKYIGTAMASKVNRHMVQKIAFGFISGFAQGLGTAVSQTNSITTTTADGTVTSTSEDLDVQDELISAGGKAVADTGKLLFDAYGNRPTTIIVDAGTPIGVFFY